MNQIAVDQLKRGIAVILEKAGLPAEASAQTADLLVETEARGVYSHGCMRTKIYIDRIFAGGTDPKGRSFVARDHKATALVDGNNAMGQVAGVYAMKIAIEKAKK